MKMWFCRAAPVAAILALILLNAPLHAQDVRVDAQQQARKEAFERAQLEATRRVLDDLIAKTQSARDELKSLNEKFDKLRQRLAGIQSNDEGKRLGFLLDRIDINELSVNLDTVVLDESQLIGSEKRLDEIHAQLSRDRKDLVQGYVPPSTIQSEINSVRGWIAKTSADLDARGNWFDMQLLAVPLDFDIATAPSYRVKWDAFQRERAQQLAEAKARAVARARQEATAATENATYAAERQRLEDELKRMQQRLEEERTVALKQHELQLEKMREENALAIKQQQAKFEEQLAQMRIQLALIQAEKDKHDAEAAGIKRQAEIDVEKERLRQRCKEPAVIELMAAFTTPGYLQPDGSRTTEKRPISLSKLLGQDVMRGSQSAKTTLFKIASNPEDKERPRWNMSRHFGVPEEKRFNEFRATIKELGPIMVEQGLLDP